MRSVKKELEPQKALLLGSEELIPEGYLPYRGRRIIIVSNRLPVSVFRRNGVLEFKPSVGGLATGMSSLKNFSELLWIGWPGIASDELTDEEKEQVFVNLAAENYFPVFLSRAEVENFYEGFCNKTIWPLFHYFPLYAVYEKKYWDFYKKTNEKFFEVVKRVTREGDIIWVQDFHLMLLPMLIREYNPEAAVGFFLHIPFPSSEVLRLLPWREEILTGLLGADLIGFHTYDYALHFLNSLRKIMGIDNSLGEVFFENHLVKVDSFPMGIDFERYNGAPQKEEVQDWVKKVRRKIGGRKIILSIDRLDYTKGIDKRLLAYDKFLKEHPEFREKVTLIMVVVPSRTKVEQYAALKHRIDEMVGKIEGEHATVGWVPIWYLYRSLPFELLVALYHLADVALVTPLRDGMNLVAKEYIAAKRDRDGMLVLSETAGAARELGEAIIINPNNIDQMAEAIYTALKMPKAEKRAVIQSMQTRIKRFDVHRWAREFLMKLGYVKEKQKSFMVRKLVGQFREKLIEEFLKAKKAIFFLDYDGTLVDFAKRPEEAVPSQEVVELLEALSRIEKLHPVMVSGRGRKVLEGWFGRINISMVAEHGVWVKERGKSWELIEPINNDWKKQIKPILELFVDRTPGSLIEEKEYSLVWHYRRTDPELAKVRVAELKEALFHLVSPLGLGVLEGSKVLEIKNMNINKGRAVLRFLSSDEYDFIFAVGDDWTDEDMFEVLPENAYSVKVRLGLSKAKFYLDSPSEVRELLKGIIQRIS